jgi:hypothetical protein
VGYSENAAAATAAIFHNQMDDYQIATFQQVKIFYKSSKEC